MTEPTPAPAAAAPFTEAEDKQYSMLATFLNIILLIPGLVFYIAFRTRGPKIGEQSKENLNWTINITALYIICFILELIPFIGLLFLLLTFALGIINLIFSILGGVKLSNTGETYRYPVNIRWIK
ncbi:MAG: hypothetical protein JWN80_1645 [Microbacteriaceae bacterium]|jgi:uncharacterized Tic20 family protein|nr:hypothetical protein [Microbacteriaceae bacterium]